MKPCLANDNRISLTATLAGILHRGLGVGDVHGLGRAFHGVAGTPRLACPPAYSERLCAPRAHWSGDGADGHCAYLLALGPTVRRAHEPCDDPDISPAWQDPAVGCRVLHRGTI